MSADHGPVQAQYRDTMNGVAEALDDVFNGDKRPRRVGWALFVFEFGQTDGGRVNYISNGERSEMIVAVKEWLARAEGRVQTGGSA